MMEYRKIVNFYYGNRKYQLLLDDNNKYFFLEVNSDNSYSYVTIENYMQLCKIFCRYPDKMYAINDNVNNSKIRVVPKVIIKGIATLLTVTTLAGCGVKTDSEVVNIDNTDDSYSATQVVELSNEDSRYILDSVSLVVDDKDSVLVVDTYLDNQYTDNIYVYEMDMLDNYLNYGSVSIDELLNVVNNNHMISDRFRPYLYEFINSMCMKYPDCDKRMFYENLKTLKIIECNDELMFEKTGSRTADACYISTENEIYTKEDSVYEKGTWEYQVLMHEIAHAVRNGIIENGDRDIRVSAMGNALSLVTVDEALNSVFTVSLFDYEERDIAYQLQSNYCTLMLECLDNYDLSDYVDHSLSYYAKKLDEHNGHNNYATTIFALIDAQYKDFHSDEISIEQNEFYRIYDYIANMYYNKYITNEMNYSECRMVADSLVERILYDVPIEYNIDADRFYEYLDIYCVSRGIDVENISRGR